MADEMNEEQRQCEEAWLRDRDLVNRDTTVKAIYVLGFMQGRVAGIDAGMKIAIPDNGLTPEAAAKLESVTIGETLHHDHLADVLRVQKQTG